MTNSDSFEIFLATPPGLERTLASEMRALGFYNPVVSIGGVTIEGGWQHVWKANLLVRGASHVLVRIASFRALHLAQLAKRAKLVPWLNFLKPDVPVKIDVTCKKSRIYHSDAAKERIADSIRATTDIKVVDTADVCLKVRIFDDMCTISIDTSGEPLHKRGHKEAVNKAPMRENLAASILRASGYVGSECVVDPMCGSGTFIIEAAEIAAGVVPGRTRPFAFEQLKSFDAAAWQNLKSDYSARETDIAFYGFDRDKGAVSMSAANAKRAGVHDITHFTAQPISGLNPPAGEPGLVVINPPYGTRIGEVKKLTPLYATLGKTLREKFAGWRIALVTNNDALAKATGIKFRKNKLSFSHGGIKVTLFQATLK